MHAIAGCGCLRIWVYDSNNALIRNCTSHDNLSSLKDGGGFDLDLQTNNSVIEYCTSYNNYGKAYMLNTGGEYGGNNNNIIRHSTSYNDGWGTYAAISVFVQVSTTGSQITNGSIYNMTITIPMTNLSRRCRDWGTVGMAGAMNGLWVQGDYVDVKW